MKKIIFVIAVLVASLCPSQSKAQDFFDTSDAASFFSFSGRLGFNTSNKTFPKGHFNLWNNNSWGTGFNIGVLANLNFKEYLSLQPGIFFESRSGDYAYLTNYLNYNAQEDTHYAMGHLRGYYITVPVMGVVKFNIAEKIKWMVELGPYLQFALKHMGDNNIVVLYRQPQNLGYSQYTAQHNSVDVGLKMGTGLRFFDHYYLGVHYLAGFCKTWKQPSGGKNKSWEFSIGYDF
ncbi:MAG: PorT family protein [Muribaculaceae bacterium]|nr:PorT family protein [Muribaculaceae bacterium]